MAEGTIIKRRCFATLILDAEYDYDADFNLPALVVCRVLIDGRYSGTIYAETLESAIRIFEEGKWE